MSEELPVSTRRRVPDHMFGGRLKGSYLLDLEVVGVDEVAPHVRLITMASTDLLGFEYTPVEFDRAWVKSISLRS